MALGDPLESESHFDIQQKRYVGDGAIDRELIDGQHLVNRETATVALISSSGICEAVADHDRPAIQSRNDHVTHELGAACGKEQDFRFGTDRLSGLVVLKNLPDGLARRSSAWLPRVQDFAAQLFQPFNEEACLRGFSTAFGAFERNEFSTHEMFYFLFSFGPWGVS